MSLRRKIVLVGGLISIALIGFFSFISYSNYESSQDQKQREELAQLAIRARDFEERAEEVQKILDNLNKEYEIIVKERDKLVKERMKYPRDTSEDIIKENKTLRVQLIWNEGTLSIGDKTLTNIIEENRTLRIKNFGLRRENQTARDYLENQGIYISDINGKEIDPTQNPLYLERARHEKTRADLVLAQTERDTDLSYYKDKFYKLGQEITRIKQELSKTEQELSKAEKERDSYKKGYEDWVNYAKSQKIF